MHTFRSPVALLSNSGSDANVGMFVFVPLLGDTLLQGEATHTSIHDGARVCMA
jgi:7-keto-8-aminopelargonate synthetase-like enzyme